MASASSKSTAFFHQNGKMDPLLQNSNQEISQDMQLKMSKKIAQLTKVVCCGNITSVTVCMHLIITLLCVPNCRLFMRLIRKTMSTKQLYRV
jgi:phosphoheptose isomerase